MSSCSFENNKLSKNISFSRKDLIEVKELKKTGRNSNRQSPVSCLLSCHQRQYIGCKQSAYV